MAEGTLLLVEDSDDDVFLMCRAFRKAQMEPSVHIVNDGASAMAYLNGDAPYADRTEHPFPKLILLDLNLPVMTGIDVLRWIRAQPALAHLPVYVYSASIRSTDADRALTAGATGFLVKPAGTDELVRMAEKLKALLGQ